MVGTYFTDIFDDGQRRTDATGDPAQGFQHFRGAVQGDTGDALSENAGLFTGDFLEGALEEYNRMVAVNCASTIGLIHGLAFASSFLSLEGSEGLIGHLLAFNVGIEVAQVLVVLIILSVSFIFVQFFRIPRIWWIRISSVIILSVSLKMAFERFPHNKIPNQTAQQ